MERSQSFTNFDLANSQRSQNNNNNKNNNLQFASISSPNLRKLLELRQTQLQLQQQHQQLQLQRQHYHLLQRQQQMPLQHAFSSDNLITHQRLAGTTTTTSSSSLSSITTAAAAATTTTKTSTTNMKQLSQIQALRMRRLKTLTRQKSAASTDDFDYAAEDELEDDDDQDAAQYQLNKLKLISNEHSLSDITNIATIPPISPLSTHQQKLLRFQRQKPKSDVAMTTAMREHLFSTSSTTATASTSAAASAAAIADAQPSNLKKRHLKYADESSSFDSGTTTTTTATTTTTNEQMSPISHRQSFSKLKRDNSLHSDSSRYSSVDSLLESRKPDPEAILINLGFGPVVSEDILSRIPKRFLKPSQVRGIDTDAFIRRLQLANTLADHSVLGYRGLIGNPDLPPSSIVAKIMERFEVNERKKSMGSIEQTLQ